MRYKFVKKSHFVCPLGKSMTPHLLRYQGLAVDDYGFTLDVSNLGASSTFAQLGCEKTGASMDRFGFDLKTVWDSTDILQSK